MKAERRHDLETNDLAKKIIQAPDYFKLYGGRIPLGVVLVVVAVLLVNYQIRNKRANLAASQEGVGAARDAVVQLGMLNAMAGPPQEVAVRRQQLISNAVQAIDTVNERSEDPKLLSQAQVLRGDLYWTVANLSELPGAATQPALAVEPKAEDALGQAESAYKRVLESYADQKLPAVTARFGLAAIAENRGKWDDARHQYETLAADPNVPAVYKTQAQTRLGLLSHMEKGVFVATSAPATQPAAPAAVSAPSSQPAR